MDDAEAEAIAAGRVVVVPYQGARYFLFLPMAHAVARATSRRFVAMVAGDVDGQPERTGE